MDDPERTPEELAELDEQQADLLDVEAEWETRSGDYEMAAFYLLEASKLRRKAQQRREESKK